MSDYGIGPISGNVPPVEQTNQADQTDATNVGGEAPQASGGIADVQDSLETPTDTSKSDFPESPAVDGQQLLLGAFGNHMNSLMGAFEKNMDSMNDVMDQVSKLDPNSKTYQQDLMQIQNKMQQLQQMQTMISEMLKKINDLNETIIRNLGA